MRTTVNTVEALFSLKQLLPHAAMEGLESLLGNQSFCDGALIAYQQHQKAGVTKTFHCFGSARQELDFRPTGYVGSFRLSPVDNAVAIKKYRAYPRQWLSQRVPQSRGN